MNRYNKKIKYYWVIVLSALLSLQIYAQEDYDGKGDPIGDPATTPIVLSGTSTTKTCNIGSGSATITVPDEVLTGDNIMVNFTLTPGSSTCVSKVTITHSGGLNFYNSSTVAFANQGNDTFQSEDITSNLDFIVTYQFPNFTTCNGTVGTISVNIETDCDGVISYCKQDFQVVARADNHWEVFEEFVTGNLTCGVSIWKFHLKHNNPNPGNLGTYGISGTISEYNSTISDGLININISNPSANHDYDNYNVYIRNCVEEGETITNTAFVDLMLGGDCGEITGDISAVSPPVASPNADISLVKSVVNYDIDNTYNNLINLTPGCTGAYQITIVNNGNVAWTDLILTDLLPDGVSLDTSVNISYPSGTGLTVTPQGNSHQIEIATNSGYILYPGESMFIQIPFTIDSNVQPGDIITNTAYLQYQAYGDEIEGVDDEGDIEEVCPGIDCPEIDYSILNTEWSVSFIVEEPKAVPFLKKCIVDPPQTSPPIYSVGDIIKFRFKISNFGAGNMNSVLTDVLTLNGQNLQIIPGSIQTSYYELVEQYYARTCNPIPVPQYQGSLPFTFTADVSNTQSPIFTIQNMPGNCNYFYGNVLVVDFEAEILPQMYGNKTNRVNMETERPDGTIINSNSTVVYSIDQAGKIGVTKSSDTDFAENGETFNYIIQVTNNQSVPLNEIKITDQLPECVELAGEVTMVDYANNPVSFSTQGSSNWVIEESVQLNPNQTITVTIPVRKLSGSNCCNESVRVEGRMITSGSLLYEVYGSEENPAACVRSTECCDIDDFEATLVRDGDSFVVHINGGSVPLQEVDITMLDYHVEYSAPDCKPQDMGIFGGLTTTTESVGGLIIQTAEMASNSLVWGLGTPTVINESIVFNVVQPNVLDLECCDYTLEFCIKVSVKDANCNVCEITLCYDGSHECDLSELVATSLGEGCFDDGINLTWSGSSSSGTVDILVADPEAMIGPILVGQNISGNSYSFNMPSEFACDDGNKTFLFIVRDSDLEDVEQCMIATRLTIDCCVSCECGKWLEDIVTLQRGSLVREIKCGSSLGSLVRLLSTGTYNLTAPAYDCNGNCDADYRWIINGPNNTNFSYEGETISHNFNISGIYTVTVVSRCGEVDCERCVITFHIRGRLIPDKDVEIFNVLNKLK